MIITEQKVIEMMQSVLDMRDAQRRYFKHRTDSNLRSSLHKEGLVDNQLNLFMLAGIIKPKVQPGETPAPKLFV